MSDPLHMLIIEDSPVDAELSVLSLKKGGFVVDWKRVENPDELQTALKSARWDLVISDYNLPKFNAVQALKIVQEHDTDLPFILISGAVGEETAVELIKAGASDYVMKSKLWRLPLAVTQTLRAVSSRTNERLSIERAERAVRAREHVLAIVSHDMKNPLGAIDLNHQLMERILSSPHSPESLQERDKQIRLQLSRARRATQRMKSLIMDVLDQSQIESGRFQVQISRSRAEDLVSEVVEMFQPLAMQKSILLEWTVPQEPAWADFDHERTFQVLTNLVGNAVKFTSSLGRIEITLEITTSKILFRVKDNGPGIPTDIQNKIFERFWQANDSIRQGVGLGLSIAKGIVEAHKGHIRVESTPGEGSTFEFWLPRWRTDMSKEAVLTPVPRTRLEPRKFSYILLVDDDEDLRQVIEQTLVSQGYTVQSAGDAESCLKSVLNTHLPPSLIILDYTLPGMSGAQFVEKIRAVQGPLRDVPILLASGEDDIANKARSLNVQAVLRKPATLQEILTAVHEVLGTEATAQSLLATTNAPQKANNPSQNLES